MLTDIGLFEPHRSNRNRPNVGSNRKQDVFLLDSGSSGFRCQRKVKSHDVIETHFKRTSTEIRDPNEERARVSGIS